MFQVATRMRESVRSSARAGQASNGEQAMKFEGGCYCKAVRYQSEGAPMFKGQAHSRECHSLPGGSPNVIVAMPEAGFKYTKGAPKKFKRADLPNGVTRE